MNSRTESVFSSRTLSYTYVRGIRQDSGEDLDKQQLWNSDHTMTST